MSNTTTPPLPRISPQTQTLLHPEPLLPSTFAPFGTAILSPLPQHLRSVPSNPQIQALHPPHQPRPQPANQNTALKTSPISPLTNNYPSSPGSPEAHGQVSIFSCFPRQNTYLDPTTGKLRLNLEILERHPYTTQTFCPFNFSTGSPPEASTTTTTSPVKTTYFLVVVAPTLQDPAATPPNPPDLTRVRAFLAPVTPDAGLGMAVTYAPGTWHAPMVVLGERRVDFLVTQFANRRSHDDCQEVLVGAEPADVNRVEVDLAGLGIGVGSELELGLWRWRAKL